MAGPEQLVHNLVRWESGSRERLANAALHLFAAQGFEGTTVAQIADEARLTERTFFRYYADKREVLFVDQERFEGLFLAGLAGSTSDRPDGARRRGDHRSGGLLSRREAVVVTCTRAQVLADNDALMERELHKMSALAETLGETLMSRGIDPTSAAFAAEAAVSVFRRSFAAWVAEGEERSFTEISDAAWRTLRQLRGPRWALFDRRNAYRESDSDSVCSLPR